MLAEDVKTYRHNYRQRDYVQRKMRNDHLVKKYEITLDEYEKLFISQGSKCAICGRCDTGMKNQKWFHVDHLHKSKHIRGILCQQCNTGLGAFSDSPELLMKAAQYIASHEEFDDEH